MSRPLLGVLAGVLVAAVAVSPTTVAAARAQEDSEPAAETEASQPEEFFEVVDVQVVNIDVWVTDRQGQPVAGLERDDFEVLRDGQPVEVTNFYAVAAGGRSTDAAPAQESEQSEEGRPRAAEVPLPLLEAPPEHRLWMIVYVDNYNLDPIERNQVLPALQSFLARALGVGGQAMLVTYDRSLEVRQPFTDNVPLLMEKLDTLRKEAGLATIRRRERFSTLKQIDETSSYLQAMGYARNYAEELRNSLEYTTDALDKLIETLAGLPGRKALVHVSSGMPMLAGEEMFHVIAEKFGRTEAYAEIPRQDTSRAFERVNRNANAHRVAFYTLDAGGLRSFEFGAAEYSGFISSRFRSTLDSIVPENLQAPLRFMALETGGRAIVNTNEFLPALDGVVSDLGSFYSLGIQSSDTESGRYHKIKVRLREGGGGWNLRHRTGYRSKTMETRVREALRSALLYSHGSNPLDLEVEWGRPQKQARSSQYVLPIRVAIPLRGVVLLPIGSGRQEARLRLFVGAVGESGQTSEIDDAPIGLRLADEHVEAAKAESILHTHRLLVGGGRQKIGVAVLDVFGNQSAVVTGILDIGPGSETGSR